MAGCLVGADASGLEALLVVVEAVAVTGRLPEAASWEPLRVGIRVLMMRAFADFAAEEGATTSSHVDNRPRAGAPTPAGEREAAAAPPSDAAANGLPDAALCVLRELDLFESAPPFTIQRICELVLAPRTHYRTLDKFAHALSNCLLVCGTT